MTNVQESTDPLDREYAASWRPEAGEKVRGKLVDLSSRERDEAFGGGRYAILTLELAEPARAKDEWVDDFVAIHCIHEVLERELARIRPKLGDELGIRYEGKHPDRNYHRYRVHRYGDDGSGFDWSAFDGDEDVAVHAPLEDRSPAKRPDEGTEEEGDDDSPF
jgi:hypothetical protein